MSQPTILELADKYAKEYYMGRDEEARKRLQAAIINNETNAYAELKKVQEELDAFKVREKAWEVQHWEMAEALTDMLKDFKLLRASMHEIRCATDSKALRTMAEAALNATLPTHSIYQDGDENVPEVICDSNGSVALGLCKTCGRGEIELEELCIPRKMMERQNGQAHSTGNFCQDPAPP